MEGGREVRHGAAEDKRADREEIPVHDPAASHPERACKVSSMSCMHAGACVDPKDARTLTVTQPNYCIGNSDGKWYRIQILFS